MKLIELDLSNCTGCRCCEMACSLKHEQECSASKSRIKIIRDEEFGNHLISNCMQCTEAYCIENCSTHALTRDERTGAIIVNSELCNGCKICVSTCPMIAISFDDRSLVVRVCDLCGGDPECVKVCTRGAIIITEVDLDSRKRKSHIETTSKLLYELRN